MAGNTVGSSAAAAASSSSPVGLTKTMEEVWSNIELSSLRDYPIPHPSAFRPFLLHDFFSPPSKPAVPPPPNKRSRHDILASADRRHKRMIKNRESSARSRARKQAYTNELEREVAILREENARLRRQQEKLCLTSLDRHLKMRNLVRTSTAPF